MLPLTKEELKSHQDAKVCYICRKIILQNLQKIKIIEKLEIIAIVQVNMKLFMFQQKKKLQKLLKNGNRSVVTISYKMKIFDSGKFMVTSLSILLIISQKEFTNLKVKVVIVSLNMKASRTI